MIVILIYLGFIMSLVLTMFPKRTLQKPIQIKLARHKLLFTPTQRTDVSKFAKDSLLSTNKEYYNFMCSLYYNVAKKYITVDTWYRFVMLGFDTNKKLYNNGYETLCVDNLTNNTIQLNDPYGRTLTLNILSLFSATEQLHLNWNLMDIMNMKVLKLYVELIRKEIDLIDDLADIVIEYIIGFNLK